VTPDLCLFIAFLDSSNYLSNVDIETSLNSVKIITTLSCTCSQSCQLCLRHSYYRWNRRTHLAIYVTLSHMISQTQIVIRMSYVDA